MAYCITCPKCEEEIEYTMAIEEDYSGRVVGVVDEWKRDCPCLFTESEEEALIQKAEASAEEWEPDEDTHYYPELD